MQTINAQQVKHMWDRGEDFVLVNTLPADQFPATKIPGAVNIPEASDDFVGRVLQKAEDKGKPLVVYGANRSCECAASAAKKLLDASFEDVWVFEEGAQGWREFMKAKRSLGAARW
ncbi:MAG TPA: rhodanese-like domain-containing protein [Lacipirellulaceae bacterium]|nr:rhodanese-like domain-containing protein [Lacipirellulaceae bacterium]